MGVWGEGFFDNDDAMDLVDSLIAKGPSVLSKALGKQFVEGLTKSPISKDEIDRLVQIQIEKHRKQLSLGLKVGPVDEAERIWRETFELDAEKNCLWEIFPYAAALSVLAKTVRKDVFVPEAVTEWMLRNEGRLNKHYEKCVEIARHSWHVGKENGVVIETLRRYCLEGWVAQITTTINALGSGSCASK